MTLSGQANAALELARALKRLVNARLPVHPGAEDAVDLDTERAFWVAARNARATLDTYAEQTGINGEQETRDDASR